MESVIGERFGRLVAIGVEKPEPQRKGRKVICRCDCGNEKAINYGSLKSGRTKSCGCLRKETARITANKNIKHGKTNTRLYTIWGSMLKRCRNENDPAYPRYGGRGIAVCLEWCDFENFQAWAIENGYSENLTLDRKDTNGDYCPENCRWTTPKVQSNNKRNNHNLTIFGETHTVAEWSEISGTKRVTIHARLRRGLDAQNAVFGEKKIARKEK